MPEGNRCAATAVLVQHLDMVLSILYFSICSVRIAVLKCHLVLVLRQLCSLPKILWMCQRWSGIWHMDTGHSPFRECSPHLFLRSALKIGSCCHFFALCLCRLSWSTPQASVNTLSWWVEEHKEWCCDKFSIGCLGFSCCWYQKHWTGIPEPVQVKNNLATEVIGWRGKSRKVWKFGLSCFCVLCSSKVIHPISAWKTLTIGLLAVPCKPSIQVEKTGQRSNHALSAEQPFRVLNRCLGH